MKKNEIILEFMKAIAPVITTEGMNLQERIIKTGGDPSKCTVGGRSIFESYAFSARVWAEAYADEYVKSIIKDAKGE